MDAHTPDHHAPTGPQPLPREKNRTLFILIICMIAVDIIIAVVFYDLFSKQEAVESSSVESSETPNN